MNSKQFSIVLIMLVASSPAFADQDHVNIRYPEIYREECGSCHVAFPSYLLSPQDWRRVMERLDKHYGTRLEDIHIQSNILDWLESNTSMSIIAPSDNYGLPLMTQTARFHHDHHEVPHWIWKDPRVKSRTNCQACHKRAESGSYSEREIIFPELQEKEEED